MKVTIDANVFFSALIRDGFTRSLMIKSDFTLYAPQFILIEFNKHESYLLEKSKLDIKNFNEVKETLLKYINLISDESLKPYLIPASTLNCINRKSFSSFLTLASWSATIKP